MVLGILFGKIKIVVWVVSEENFFLISSIKVLFELIDGLGDGFVIRVVMWEKVEDMKFNFRCVLKVVCGKYCIFIGF